MASPGPNLAKICPEKQKISDFSSFSTFLGFPLHTGLGNGFRKRSRLYKIANFWAFVGFVPKAGNPGNPQGAWKWLPLKSGLYKIDNYWAFVGFPPFRRSQRPEIQQNHSGLGNGFRKGLYKIDNSSISAVPRPEIQEIQSGLGNGFRKRSGLYKIDNCWALWGSLHFGGPRGRKSRKFTEALAMASAKGAAGNPTNPQRASEMASAKGADSAKSTTFGLLWVRIAARDMYLRRC